MPHHVDIAELERRKAHLEEELEHLQQQLQRLRLLRAQVVHQQSEVLRQHGPGEQYDELQQQFQELLKAFVATLEERVIIIDLLSQFERNKEDRVPTTEAFWNARCTDSIEQQKQWPILRLSNTPVVPWLSRMGSVSILTTLSTHPVNNGVCFLADMSEYLLFSSRYCYLWFWAWVFSGMLFVPHRMDLQLLPQPLLDQHGLQRQNLYFRPL